jgi:hypothetical protein
VFGQHGLMRTRDRSDRATSTGSRGNLSRSTIGKMRFTWLNLLFALHSCAAVADLYARHTIESWSECARSWASWTIASTARNTSLTNCRDYVIAGMAAP